MQLLFGKNCVSETAKHTFFGIWLEYRPIYRIPGLYCTRTRARLIRARSVNAAGDVRIETWRPSIQLLLYSENDEKRRSMAKILILYVENQMAVSEFRPQNDNSHQHTCTWIWKMPTDGLRLQQLTVITTCREKMSLRVRRAHFTKRLMCRLI